jgi:hypothetical protein
MAAPPMTPDTLSEGASMGAADGGSVAERGMCGAGKLNVNGLWRWRSRGSDRFALLTVFMERGGGGGGGRGGGGGLVRWA